VAKVTWLTPLADGNPAEFRLTRADGRVVATELERAFDRASRKRGLLGRDGLDPSAALLIAPCPAVHTFFMRFPIDVVFADREGRVLKVYPHLKRSRIAVALGAFVAIEMAAGAIESAGITAGDRLVLARPEVR
jgi:uncharacterized membrane protein (UPF0127 family)